MKSWYCGYEVVCASFPFPSMLLEKYRTSLLGKLPPTTHWAWKEQAQIPFPSSLPLCAHAREWSQWASSRQPGFREHKKGEAMAGAEVGKSKAQRFHCVPNSWHIMSPLGQLLNIMCTFTYCLVKPPKTFQVPPTPKAFCIISSLD